MDPSYVAGFFDGEGCVYSRVKANGSVRIRLHMDQMKAEVLYRIQEYLGYGKIYYRRSNGSTTLHIDRIADCLKFIELIAPHSVVKADQLYLAWLILNADAMAERRDLHSQLQSIRRRGRKAKTGKG